MIKILQSQIISYWRENPIGHVWICAFIGLVVGAVTVFFHVLVQAGHELVFRLSPHAHLSAAKDINPFLVIGIPVAGGVALSVFNIIAQRLRNVEIVDPIEANAVHGGRMPMPGSIRLLLSTLISNAAGMSVGMEAAYTQIGSSIMSSAGQRLKLRREDLRVFVAAGAAAAIAAAFNAPLAGAFYGFELILGSYTIAALSQVMAAALSGVLMLHILSSAEPLFYLHIDSLNIPPVHYFLFIALGIFSAGVGIATMKAVTRCEHVFRELFIPGIYRPALGGLLLGMAALSFPQILGSGQGAIDDHLQNQWPLLILLFLLAAKIFGTAITIGSGFRGGMFSASLFIGCLLGQIIGMIVHSALLNNPGEVQYFMLAGMGAVAASIIGAPVTIILLVLEMTENFSVAGPVLAAVLISSVVTRYFFGYSFSTWRFHLRGLRITGAHDVGWISDVTVGSMMRTGLKTVLATTPVPELRKEFPPGGIKWIFLTDEAGTYQGIIDAEELHDSGIDATVTTMVARDLSQSDAYFLLPHQNIKEALNAFATWKIEELPVLAMEQDRIIIGALSEAYVLRRYAQELEARNMAQSSTATPPAKAVS